MHMYVFVNPTLRCLYTVLANPANVRHVHLLPWFYTVCTYAFVRFCQPYFTVYIYILIYWVGQNHIYTLYMTVYLVVSLPRIPYIHRIYMVLANPIYIYGSGQPCKCVPCAFVAMVGELSIAGSPGKRPKKGLRG